MKNSIFAAIDIGSFNCRLTIVRAVKGSFKIIHNFSHSTNLIKNLSFNNEFNDENTEKTLKCLKEFSKRLKSFNVDFYRCIATEACRQVINPEFFVKKVKDQTGINVEIISTNEEAKLSLKSCDKYLTKMQNRGIIFDIGGGSTELTFFDSKEKIFNSRSISFGVINLSEKIDLFSKELINKQISDHFLFFRNDLKNEFKHDFFSIGSCSTVTTLCAVHQKLEFFDLKKIEGYEMNKNELLETIKNIEKLNNNELKKISCVGSRFNLLLNGIIILKFILEIFPITKIIVTQMGLREGILKDLSNRDEKN